MTTEVNKTPQSEPQPEPQPDAQPDVIAQQTSQWTPDQLGLLLALASLEAEAVNPPKGEVTLARKQKLYEIMTKRKEYYSPSSLLKQLQTTVGEIEAALIVESYHAQLTYYDYDQVTHVSFTEALRATFPTAVIYAQNGKDCSLWHLFVAATDGTPSTETLWKLVDGHNQYASNWQPYFVGERELVNFNPEFWSAVP